MNSVRLQASDDRDARSMIDEPRRSGQHAREGAARRSDGVSVVSCSRPMAKSRMTSSGKFSPKSSGESTELGTQIRGRGS